MYEHALPTTECTQVVGRRILSDGMSSNAAHGGADDFLSKPVNRQEP